MRPRNNNESKSGLNRPGIRFRRLRPARLSTGEPRSSVLEIDAYSDVNRFSHIKRIIARH
jgi:hypothetical protein